MTKSEDTTTDIGNLLTKATNFVIQVIHEIEKMPPSTELFLGLGVSFFSSLALGLPLNFIGLILIVHAFFKKPAGDKKNHERTRFIYGKKKGGEK